MQSRIGITRTAITMLVFLWVAADSKANENALQQFPSVGERRMEIVAEKIESLGCILDKRAILEAKDGRAVVFKHKADPRGDVTVTFNSLVFPKGNWILYGAKNSIDGDECEEPPEKSPARMEAVSVVLSGKAINSTPRSLDGSETYRMVYVHLQRLWGWDIRLAHTYTSQSAVHSFGYYVPEKSRIGRRKFNENQFPIINILHRDEGAALLAGALYWFEKEGERNSTDHPATAPKSKPEGDQKPKLESEASSQ
ncbi:hypothetical protein JIN77_02145 [Verrucomicrobiaceae bacterium R5-34]|nr:hypothetical protein [Verrucomicrobiaceae bacterium R5-34]